MNARPVRKVSPKEIGSLKKNLFEYLISRCCFLTVTSSRAVPAPALFGWTDERGLVCGVVAPLERSTTDTLTLLR